MRQLLAIAAFALFVSPALAEDWKTYENPRFGFTVDVPADGWKELPPPENGDGQTWRSNNDRANILAWGSYVLDDFATDAASRVAADKDKGWTITADMGWNMDLKEGPEGWHVYSATLDGRMIEQKAIVACGGSVAVYVRLEYFESDIGDILPMSDTLISSLKAPSGEACGNAQ
jgi:hypothetical protein